jgi:hypothetical protein
VDIRNTGDFAQASRLITRGWSVFGAISGTWTGIVDVLVKVVSTEKQQTLNFKLNGTNLGE